MRCACDRAIVACVSSLPLPRSDFVRRGMAAAVATYFANTACCCPNKGWVMPVQQSRTAWDVPHLIV
ncbi:hypothetical protein OEZ86_010228 [Tetradesmus obliquus]|nr:hypothetical protein OEZ86_010228 [Tetradesmus obliquus]